MCKKFNARMEVNDSALFGTFFHNPSDLACQTHYIPAKCIICDCAGLCLVQSVSQLDIFVLHSN